jgi:hypothetical protein
MVECARERPGRRSSIALSVFHTVHSEHGRRMLFATPILWVPHSSIGAAELATDMP